MTKQSSDSEATSKPQSNDMSSSSTQELVVESSPLEPSFSPMQ